MSYFEKFKKNKNITICNETLHPGEQALLALPLPELFSCAPMHMPINSRSF